MGRKKHRGWFQALLGSSTRISTLSPWDRGLLEAHRMNAIRTQQIRDRQAKATRQRRGLLARLWPPRRLYLDGLLWGIAGELKRRGKGD
jgi:hypothetical protein